MASDKLKSSHSKSITLSKEDYDDATVLVEAVKDVNRSVASLNRALIKLQEKIASQCINNSDNDISAAPNTLH